MPTATRTLPALRVTEGSLEEVLRCVVHSVLFARSLGAVRPADAMANFVIQSQSQSQQSEQSSTETGLLAATVADSLRLRSAGVPYVRVSEDSVISDVERSCAALLHAWEPRTTPRVLSVSFFDDAKAKWEEWKLAISVGDVSPEMLAANVQRVLLEISERALDQVPEMPELRQDKRDSGGVTFLYESPLQTRLDEKSGPGTTAFASVFGTLRSFLKGEPLQ